MVDRDVRIINILTVHKNVKVSFLAELLDVSQVTVRRDLDNLEQRGMICRSHGYACLSGVEESAKKNEISHSVKRRIAKAAAATVDDGETVMIESGSCCALFAEELALSRKNNTIITNSAFIANFMIRFPHIKIILLGGYFQPDSQVLVGPMTAKCGESFYADKFFVGAAGFVPGLGFSGKDHLRTETVTELIERANKVYVLTEAAKFFYRGMCNMLRFDRISGVFTDEGIPEDAETALLENNVRLHKVPLPSNELF
ncbi:MAG: DeoR/GlpR family DNA-binding transcription regulator [Treponema sp.]|nr:DeoR/GlpR family DNA-binding transcription regulator [Treponema sp.]